MIDGNALLGAALKSTAVLGAAYLIATVLRSRSAAVRHLVWTAAFAALLALPFLSLSLPALPLSVDDTLLPAGVIFRTTASASALSPQAAGLATEQTGANWLLLLTLLWAAGTAISLGQMALAGIGLRRMRRAARTGIIPDLAAFRQSLGIRREVDVLETEPGVMPMTWGIFRPAVFLPSPASGWTRERRRLVLLHECAHIHRFDTTTHLLARTALALHWWNPLAWLAWREFLNERERATDDLVLNAGIPPAEYAGHLLDIARHSAVGYAGVAMARPSQLESRLTAILDATRNRTAPRRTAAVVAALFAAAVVTPLAALQAQPDGASAGPLRQAIATLANQEYDRAFAQFEQAAAADPALESQATMWMGVVRERQDRTADAEALYTRALAAAGRTSPEAATIMELYARLLRAEARPDEAGNYERAAAAVRKQNGAALHHPHPDVQRAGNGINPPQLLSKVEPEYTEAARAAKYEGKVVVYAEIGVSGVAENVGIIQGLGLGLNEKALEAIAQWRFQPGTKDGQPVPVRATIEVNYRLF